MIPGPRPPNAASFASGNFDLLLSIGCSSLPPSAVVLRAQTIDFKLEQEQNKKEKFSENFYNELNVTIKDLEEIN